MEWLRDNAGWGATVIVWVVSIMGMAFGMGKKYKEIEMRLSEIEAQRVKCQSELVVHQADIKELISHTKTEVTGDIEKIKQDFLEMKFDIKQVNGTIVDVRLYIEKSFGEIKLLIANLDR